MLASKRIRVALVAALALACGKRAPAPIASAGAARFLEQATFGPTPASVAHLQQIGYDAWLDEQFAETPSAIDEPGATDMDLAALQRRFFVNAVQGKDQLRQRVAFALSQIFVVSGNKVGDPGAFSPWLRMLSADAFGSYPALLRDVTLSPAMGVYLDMVNNDRPDPVAGTSPNENYAREILQLFSIGLVKLNNDGTPKLDAHGAAIPTYDQLVIEGFAHTFTGWTFPTAPAAVPGFPNPERYDRQMEVSEAHHDNLTTKPLLRGVRLPPGQSAEKDLADALDNIVQDANVGPFIGFRLIQRLVKSNPSPAYVGRIAAAFADNGRGARGDLKAVVRAVLLDPEARHEGPPAKSDGKLREPVLYIAALLRALGAQTGGAGLADYAASMRQNLFYPTTVFNYYPPGYRLQGSTLLGPEFKLRTGPSVLARAAFVDDLLSGYIQGTTVDLAPFNAIAGDAGKLADGLGSLLLRSDLSLRARQALVSGISSLPADDAPGRARAGVFLVATSSQFEVQP
jgi:uncharacterized protein (DUF1800 family)